MQTVIGMRDLTGLRFGRYVVTGLSELRLNRKIHWECICDCGATRQVCGASLTRGVSQSCGCLGRDLVGARRRQHGMSNTVEFHAWKAIIARCGNPKRFDYARYGGRGISVCADWLNSFNAFLRDMGMRPSDKTSIDRIDTNGNYEPSNCRWATNSEQGMNTRRARYWIVDGQRFNSLNDAAHKYKVDPKTIHRWCAGHRDNCASELKYHPAAPTAQGH